MTETLQVCKQCGEQGQGNFCNHCGQAYLTKRLTIKGIIHEIFHFFSHLDKGFPYTLKSLIVKPGSTQKAYVEGHRSKHQKPFSMFFLCATIAALLSYWANLALIKYFEAGNIDDASFFHQYWVLLHIVMLPIYALITYLFFSSSRNNYNYAETFVLILYSLSIIILFSGSIQLFKLIWPTAETRFIEVPFVVVYNVITNLKFYAGEKKSIIFLKSIFSSALCFFIAAIVEYYFKDFIF